MMHKIKRFFPVLTSNLMFLRRVVRTFSSESFHKLKLKVNPVWLHQEVDPVWSHNNGSLQMKTTRSQNESELSLLLSESRLNITCEINAFLLKNERAGKLCLRKLKLKVNPVWLHQEVDPVWSHNNGSLQMKTTRSQNESEL